MENITGVSLHVFSLKLLSIHICSHLLFTFFHLCEVSQFLSDFQMYKSGLINRTKERLFFSLDFRILGAESRLFCKVLTIFSSVYRLKPQKKSSLFDWFY